MMIYWRGLSNFRWRSMGLKEEQLEVKLTGYRVSKKNVPQFLLNVTSYKHARKLGHNSLERWDP